MVARKKTTSKPLKKATAARKTAAARKAPARKAAAKKAPARKVPAKKAAAAKGATITLRHLGTELAEAHEISKKDMNVILDDMVANITKHLKKGNRVRLSGLGIMQVRKRPARMGRNPATGETIRIKASKKVAFRVAKDLKETIL